MADRQPLEVAIGARGNADDNGGNADNNGGNADNNGAGAHGRRQERFSCEH